MSETIATSQAPAPEVGERRRVDRRKYPRYAVNGGGAEVRPQGVGRGIRARLTDISLGGCRLETVRVFLGKRLLPQPLPVLTYVDLSLALDRRQLQAKGQVVVSHPNFGMGVKFLHLSDTDRPVLEAWILALAAKSEPPIARGRCENPAPILDHETAARLGQAVAEFFRSNPVMNLEEFQQLRLL